MFICCLVSGGKWRNPFSWKKESPLIVNEAESNEPVSEDKELKTEKKILTKRKKRKRVRRWSRMISCHPKNTNRSKLKICPLRDDGNKDLIRLLQLKHPGKSKSIWVSAEASRIWSGHKAWSLFMEESQRKTPEKVIQVQLRNYPGFWSCKSQKSI